MTTHHPIHLYKLRYSELSELYLSETIKSVAFSLVGVFVPVYLLQLKYSFSAICAMFLVLNLARFIIEPLVGYLVGKFGAKHILALSYPASFVSLLLIALLSSFSINLYLIAVAWAVADSLHWIAFHSNLSKVKKAKKTGRELGTLSILNVIAAAISPLIGGIVAKYYGLHVLFYVSPVLLIVATLPLFKTREKVATRKLNYSGVFKQAKYDMLAHVGFSFDVSSGAALWPLFIFLVVKGYVAVGIIVSIAFLISIISIFVVGRLADSLNKKTLVGAGSMAMSATNIMRYTAVSVSSVFTINMMGTVLGPLLGIPLFSLFYHHVSDKKRIEHTVLLEMGGDIGRALLWAITLGLSYKLGIKETLSVSFIVAAVGVLLSNSVKKATVRGA